MADALHQILAEQEERLRQVALVLVSKDRPRTARATDSLFHSTASSRYRVEAGEGHRPPPAEARGTAA